VGDVQDHGGGCRRRFGAHCGGRPRHRGRSRAAIDNRHYTGSLIIGQRDLELDGLTGLREISRRAGGAVWLYQGGRQLRRATEEERRTLPVMSVWERQVIQLLAEKHFVTDPPDPPSALHLPHR
jgi:hypothetical protein